MKTCFFVANIVGVAFCLLMPPMLFAPVSAALAQTSDNSSKMLIISQSQPLVAASAQRQRFTESISIPKGQEKLQLTLTYYNGTNSTPSYNWLRISSSSMSYITEQQFAGSKTYSIDASGELTWGGNQLLISAQGPKGATMGWMVTTPQPCVNSVSSEPINSGGSVVISGTNFSPDPNDDVVKVGGHTARCVSASTTKLVVQVPEDASGGACDVNVTVAGIDAGSGSINVSAVPYLKSLSPTWAAPPMQVTVYGQGFAPGISGNAVTVGGFQARLCMPLLTVSLS